MRAVGIRSGQRIRKEFIDHFAQQGEDGAAASMEEMVDGQEYDLEGVDGIVECQHDAIETLPSGNVCTKCGLVLGGGEEFVGDASAGAYSS